MDSIKSLVNTINGKASLSTFGRVFRLEGSGHPNERKDSRFLTEIYAGLTTFFTMAYIITVNANILSQSGGTCVCPGTNSNDPLCNDDASYRQCLLGLNRSLITATAVISGIGSIAFGIFTNLPVALAPGMGLNAYFTFQVVGYHGSGSVSYRLALTAVFIEGCIFILLSLIGMRQWLVKVIPSSIKVASGVGIGFFIAEIGMSYSGIGLISGGVATPTTIAGCPPQYLDPASGSCTSHKMTNPTLWLGIMCGGVLTAYLMCYRVKAAIIVGISLVSILSWPRGTTITYFPDTPEGNEMFSFFKQVVHFHPLSHTLVAQDWDIISGTGAGTHFVLALFTFLYVDVIDATATLYSMARFSGVVDPATGDFPRSTLAYCTDAACISIGSLFGCSPVTAFIESGAGITVGGKTGLTAITTGVCFLISMFFAPIFASIPPWATGCTLIIVGYLMMRQVVSINWGFIGDALPAFITIITMPYTYSVAYGLIAGLFSYTVLNGLIWITKVVTRGRLQPADMDLKEYWTYKTWGRELPWFVKLAQEKLWFRGQEGTWNEQIPSDAQNGSKDDNISLKSGVAGTTGSRKALVGSAYGERKVEGRQ